nr:SDR family NAD(P)-dependent oxidoreductase [Kitasatospora acidiphila]
MGRELGEAFPVFARAYEEVCAQLGVELPSDDLIHQTGFAQPGIFALEVALYRLLESWGVTAGVLAGHSVGEIAAAHVAGVLSLEDACALVVARGRLMQALPAGGAMVAVGGSEETVRAVIEGVEGVWVAAVNGPSSVVLSGHEEPVLAAGARLAELGCRTRRLTVSHAFHSGLMDPMLEEFAGVVVGLELREPVLPLVSTVTGRVESELWTQPQYWVRQVRDAVRFADGVAAMLDLGVGSFVEVGPDAVLSGMVAECLPQDGPARSVVPTMRSGRDQVRGVMEALARLHAAGTPVAWDTLFEGTGARRVDLPTYAFQRQRYWPEASAAGAQDATGLGLEAAAHPLLGAAIEVADSDELLFTGRLSLATHPWLADHTVLGSVLLPGTGFVELVLRAADQVGCGVLEELTLEAPLVLPERGAVQLQVVVGAPDGSGVRAVGVYSRPEGVGSDGVEEAWRRHAAGSLAAGAGSARAVPVAVGEWPPASAEAVDLDGFYADLLESGFAYGPLFRGLRAVWRTDDEVFAEAVLPEDAGSDPRAFGLHPALMDAALHAVGLGGLVGEVGEARLPYAWSGVRLHASGAAALRVRLKRVGQEAVSLDMTDSAGLPVVSVESLALRVVSADQLGAGDAAAAANSLYGLDWTPLPTSPVPADPERVAVVGSAGAAWFADASDNSDVTFHQTLAELRERVVRGEVARPELVFLGCDGEGGETAAVSPDAVRSLLTDTLTVVQDWVDDEVFLDAQLVVVTRGAVGVESGSDVVDLAGAAVWGLVRSAQAEYAGRLVLVDVDGEGCSVGLLAGVVGLGESQVAVRGGVVRVPRLVRVSAGGGLVDGVSGVGGSGVGVSGVGGLVGGGLVGGTVLVTGGTGALGRLVARHLVVGYGVRRLVLVSRSGEGGVGVAEVRGELEGLGAEVVVAACDVADRGALEGLLGSVCGGGEGLRGVVHVAGVLDDGVVSSLSGERLVGVLRPKVDAAWNLHELTRGMGLSLFVLFSSAAGVFGPAGQAGYAAANAFLDGLAQHRRAQACPPTPWAGDCGIWTVA